MLFDLERNALRVKESMNLLDCCKNSAISHQVVLYGCLNANSCLSFMQPTFYNCPRDLVSLAGLPTDLFGAGTTAPVSTVQSTPCHNNLHFGEYVWTAMDNSQFFFFHASICAYRHPFGEKFQTLRPYS